MDGTWRGLDVHGMRARGARYARDGDATPGRGISGQGAARALRDVTGRDYRDVTGRDYRDVTGRDYRDVTVRADVIMHAGDATARARRLETRARSHARGAAPRSPSA